MIIGAITANSPNDQYIDEIQSNQSMITGNIIAQIPQQNFSAGFQPQTQTASVISC